MKGSGHILRKLEKKMVKFSFQQLWSDVEPSQHSLPLTKANKNHRLRWWDCDITNPPANLFDDYLHSLLLLLRKKLFS